MRKRQSQGIMAKRLPEDARKMDDFESELEREYRRRRSNFLPWEARDSKSKQEQLKYQDVLRRNAGANAFGENCFISTDAHIYTHRFSIGRNSYIAAGAILRGDIKIGSNSTVNPFAHLAGTVVIGDGVRISGLVAIYGFNHGFDRLDIPIYQQETTSRGVVINDGTWIGTHVAIIDGIEVGAHCILAAGSVITKNVPDYAIVGGNPARVLRNRRDTSNLRTET